mmetsp:Transcript_18049/g.30777  ORF Transcript_18049/g.30777 Transcript_18049/m.30777 type:complete len:139 (+) Transcript_18049:839-1255(+)
MYSQFPVPKFRNELSQKSKGRVMRTHIGRVDLSDFLAVSGEEDDDESFQVTVDISETNGHKSDYIFEGISVINVADCERCPVQKDSHVIEGQRKELIIDPIVIMSTPLKEGHIFRIKSLKDDKLDKFLTYDQKKGMCV